MTAEPALDTPPPSAVSTLEENLAALDIRGRTREQVMAAAPRGRVVRQPDGNYALDLDDQTIGAPGDAASRAQTLTNIASVKNGVVVLLGLGVGHALREIRAHTSAPILVYEPDPSLLRTVLEWGPSDLGGVGICTDLVDLRLLWAATRKSRPEVTLVCSPGYKRAFPEAEAAVAATVQSLIANTHISENTHYLRARTWLTDILANVEHLVGVTSFLALEGRYQGVPAFIVGAGPSLEKNVEQLRDATKKGIVFAVNTSGRALAKHGIVPQVLACLESIDLSKDMRELPFIDEVVRAFSLSGSPAHLTMGRGPLLPTYEAIRACSVLTDLFGHAGLSVGASVTTAAVMLAERLGCNPIVLVGQDLAFTGNQAYASGTRYEGSTVSVDAAGRIVHHWTQAKLEAHGTTAGKLPQSQPLQEVPSWGGVGSVSSTPSFTAVRDWLATTADLTRRDKPELRFVNATEGGARIPNFEERTLAEVMAGMKERGITSRNIGDDAARLGKAVTRAQIHAWAERQLERVQKAKGAAVLVDKLVKKALAELDRDKPEAVTRSFRRLESAEKALRQACIEQPLIETWSNAELQRIAFATTHTRIEKSAQAEAEHALCNEGKIAEMVMRSAEELETILAKLANDHST
ncbi:MAG TPA: 6-hydroxymethylpterin diphosphokinase MptE-like protein [Polyangiaceae bacterium]|nr:6-hydroxymethylpterin diphosphokinase MptE-like protein [Polyangiaceae bacterium]